MEGLLRTDEISVKFNGKIALQNVSCTIKKGEIVLVAGPNGSGKSTLLKSIMGLVRYEGRVYLDNIDITGLKPSERFRKGLTLAPEKLRIAKNLTVEENVGIAGDVQEAFELFPELIPLAGEKTRKLSGGERQMVVLARAFVSKPKFLLLDEPFQGLHREIRERIIQYIGDISERCGVVVVTHDEIEDIFSMSDKTCLLTGGKVLYFGESEGAVKLVQKLFI
ncbi:ATP-binding cassette domain-containing protein [Archaeoglobus sp.]